MCSKYVLGTMQDVVDATVGGYGKQNNPSSRTYSNPRSFKED